VAKFGLLAKALMADLAMETIRISTNPRSLKHCPKQLGSLQGADTVQPLAKRESFTPGDSTSMSS